ncbi:uncharacterized protein [Henckelia pumila]|uniref:uncharacterized protein n=1 Tax=Henckelia pumila TaxID=405737 RepID=UPI003C6DEC1A
MAEEDRNLPSRHTRIKNNTELSDYRLRKREEFEDRVQRFRGVWVTYAKWEESQKDFTRARSVWERALGVDYRDSKLWLEYANFEMRGQFVNHARNVFDRATLLLPQVNRLWRDYIHMEEMLGNAAAARRVFERWMEWMPAQQLCPTVDLYKNFVSSQRRLQYEDEVRENPRHYDAWFDYIRLEESVGDQNRIEDVYERAIANIPRVQKKRYWRPYIYLWISYVLYQELDARNVDRTRELYKSCLETIPHDKFSFGKIWLMAARFEIRQLDIDRARRILGSAIGRAPKDKIFKNYIEMELRLGNIERCRKLYDKYLEWSPENSCVWSKFAELERSLAETERARALFERAINQPALDMPQVLWKAYIDFEISESEYERARALYERLLKRTKRLNVWISYAKFEASAVEKDSRDSNAHESKNEQKRECARLARAIFKRALSYFRTSAPELTEERVVLLEEWLDMESSFGELGNVDLVRVKLPKKLKKWRYVKTKDEPAAAYEEYVEYLFPEET